MKNLRKNTKGQFVIIAALLIAVITLSLVVSIHEINLQRQLLSYEPVEELVLGITSDLDRSLTHALSVATKQYNDTGSEQLAEKVGYDFISKWVRSILTSYSSLGLEMNINQTEAGLTDLSWSMNWGREIGISQVYAKFDLNISAYKFKGWVGRSGTSVVLKIFPNTIYMPAVNRTTLEFRIVQSKDQPIPNLTPNCLRIWVHVTKTTKILANITNLNYLGDGLYTVTFTPSVDPYTKGVDITVITPEDNIYVSAYYGKEARFLITLQSQETNSTTPTNLGSVQFGDVTYQLWPNGINASVDPGTYLLRYFAEEGHEFLNWTTTAQNITIADKYSNITSVEVEGNGTITAFYKHVITPIIVINMDSRDWENIKNHLGSITIGTNNYTHLPNSAIIAAGDYTLQYEPYNSSYNFLWWESIGNVFPVNSSANPTTLKVLGNGTIIAVYYNKTMSPPPPTYATVNLRSQEENGAATINLGKIQLGQTVFGLPNSVYLLTGTYFLEYFPAQGYAFVKWETMGSVNVANSSSIATSVTVNGNGTITAVYRGCTVLLNSRHWADLPPPNLGRITLGNQTPWYLPATITGLAQGDYFLRYTPENSSYVFLWWEFSGDAIPWNFTSNPTKVTIFGNGTITAVYGLATEPPPFVGEWSTLYVDKGKIIVPIDMWSGKSSHIPSWASTGGDSHQVVIVTSPPAPTIYLAQYVNITAYLGIDPPSNAKDVTLELGFNYSGQYYMLGMGIFNTTSDGVYHLTIDTQDVHNWPNNEPGVVPEESIFILNCVVTFWQQPWGTFKLYYGPDSPTCIELF